MHRWIGVFLMVATIAGLAGCQLTESPETVHAEEKYFSGNALDPFEELVAGNLRFIEDHPVHPHQNLARLHELEAGQHPIAVVISCSDSRVPPELIFDQGLGDLFVIRNAGNIVDDYELGSVEYAVEHLHTKLVVVMGHESCGAISAFLSHKHDSVPNHIQYIIDYIKAEPEEQVLDDHAHNYPDLAVEANVLQGIHVLQQSEPVLAQAIARGDLRVVGGVYNMHSGEVRWLDEK